MKVQESLQTARRQIIEKLRLIDPETVGELEQVERALAAIRPERGLPLVEPREFAGMTALAAARAYLLRIGRPTPIQELANALIAGGLDSKGERAAEWKIAQSFGWQKSKGNLTIENGLVGLPEWKATSAE